MSTRSVAPTVAAPVPVLAPLQRPMVQRTCDCGQHTGGGECEECKRKKKVPLRRHASGAAPSAIAPLIVHDVLRSSGQQLDLDTRAFMESRFRQDFSQVRVHSDELAAESACAVGAHAYTVGSHVVFGAGRYSPPSNHGKRLLAHELSHVLQQRNLNPSAVQHSLEVGPANDPLEREAEEAAEQITAHGDPQRQDTAFSTATPRVQRAAATGSSAAGPSTPGPSTSETATATQKAAALLVEDDARDVQQGQMRKGEFLDKLQVAVCGAADGELAAVGRTAKGCPYIERWIGHLRKKGSQFVERAIRKYAPDSAGVTTAEGYIPFVTARVRRGVARWAKTGEITEVPDELKGQLALANAADAMDKLFSGVGGVFGVVGSAAVAGIRAVGGLFAKEREGGVRDAGDPRAIQAQLGAGQPLDGGVKSRMESAFGGDFSQVRVHNDSNAASLSTQVNARAFTVGRDVAFGAGEYQPGTLTGDALIAHELAHVVQQQGSNTSVAPMSRGATEYNALEEDADMSAVGAMASVWAGAKVALNDIGKNALPRLRSGLGLQRCNKGGPCSVTETKTITTAKQTAAGWVTTALGKLRTTPVPAPVSTSLQRNFGATDGVAANIPSIITKITTANTEMTTVPVSCAGTEDSTCAKAPCGYTPSAGGHAYVICRNATLTPGTDPIYQAGCVLHEAFHSASSDFTGDSYSGWGGHSGSTSSYPGSNPLKNADSYTSLVIDLK